MLASNKHCNIGDIWIQRTFANVSLFGLRPIFWGDKHIKEQRK